MKRRIWGNFGWYRGNPFKAFGFTVWEADMWGTAIIEIQIAKFVIGFGVDRWTE